MSSRSFHDAGSPATFRPLATIEDAGTPPSASHKALHRAASLKESPAELRSPLVERGVNQPVGKTLVVKESFRSEEAARRSLVAKAEAKRNEKWSEDKLKERESDGLLSLLKRTSVSSCLAASSNETDDFQAWLQKQRCEMDGLFQELGDTLDQRRALAEQLLHDELLRMPDQEAISGSLAPAALLGPAECCGGELTGEEACCMKAEEALAAEMYQEDPHFENDLTSPPRVSARYIGAAAVLGLPGGETPEPFKGPSSSQTPDHHDLSRYFAPSEVNTPAKASQPVVRRTSRTVSVVEKNKCQVCVLS